MGVVGRAMRKIKQCDEPATVRTRTRRVRALPRTVCRQESVDLLDDLEEPLTDQCVWS
jgi:hypothetical protein